ncbi:unnamed protein product [Schistosoma rodhaini]|uniref:CTF/NF-I domain-containing protein n=1 Tax=Schistosoma rodhaini TaxID=6188 RepID=A0AA85G9Z8_9TREM|nr:unnamed protein product [Schistosoma rodhaini]
MEPNNINVKPEPLFSNLSTGVVYPLSIHDPGNNQLSPSCTVLQDDSFTNSNSIRIPSVGFALNGSDKLDTSTTVCLSSQTKTEFYSESDKSNHNSFSSSTDSNTKPLSVHCAEDSSNVFSAQSSLPSLSSEFQVPNLPNECSHKLPVHAAAKPSEALFVRALIGRCKRIAPLWFRGVSSMRERNREENRRMACNSGQSQSDWSLIALKIGEMNAGSETDAVSNLLKKLYKELPSDSVFWFLKCWLGSEDTLNDPHSCVISRGDAKGRMRRIDGGKGSDKVWRLDTIVGMLYHGLPMSSTDTNIMVHTCDHELCVRPQHIRFRASSVALVVVLKALAQAGYTIIPPSIAANSEGIASNVSDEYVDVFGPFSIEQLQQYRSENLNPANESISKLTLSASDRDLIDLVPVIKDALQKSETSMTITTGSMSLNRANSFPNSYLSYGYPKSHKSDSLHESLTMTTTINNYSLNTMNYSKQQSPIHQHSMNEFNCSTTATTAAALLSSTNINTSIQSYNDSKDYNGGIHHFKSERSNLKRPRPISPSSFPSSPAKNSYHHYYSSSSPPLLISGIPLSSNSNSNSNNNNNTNPRISQLHPQIRRPSDSTLLTNGNISSLISNNPVSNNTSSAFYTFSTHDNSALSRSLQCGNVIPNATTSSTTTTITTNTNVTTSMVNSTSNSLLPHTSSNSLVSRSIKNDQDQSMFHDHDHHFHSDQSLVQRQHQEGEEEDDDDGDDDHSSSPFLLQSCTNMQQQQQRHCNLNKDGTFLCSQPYLGLIVSNGPMNGLHLYPSSVNNNNTINITNNNNNNNTTVSWMNSSNYSSSGKSTPRQPAKKRPEARTPTIDGSLDGENLLSYSLSNSLTSTVSMMTTSTTTGLCNFDDSHAHLSTKSTESTTNTFMVHHKSPFVPVHSRIGRPNSTELIPTSLNYINNDPGSHCLSSFTTTMTINNSSKNQISDEYQTITDANVHFSSTHHNTNNHEVVEDVDEDDEGEMDQELVDIMVARNTASTVSNFSSYSSSSNLHNSFKPQIGHNQIHPLLLTYNNNRDNNNNRQDLQNSDEIGSASPNGRRVIAAIVAALANVSESPLMMESSTPVNNSRRSVSACSLPHFDGNTFNEDSIDLFSHPNHHHQNQNNHNNGNFITNIQQNPIGQSIKNHSLNGGNNEWNTSNKLMTKKSLRLGIGDEQPLTPPPPKLMSSTSSSSSSSSSSSKKLLTPLSGSLIRTTTTTSTSFTDDHTTLDIIPKLSPNVNCTMNDDDDNNNNVNNIGEYNLNRKNSSPQESSMQELASLLRNSPASGISQELIDMLANMAQQYGMQQSRTGSRASRPSSQVAQRFYRSLVNGSVCGSPFPITPVGSSSSSTFNFLHTPNNCVGVSGVSVGGIVTCEQNNNITPLSYCHQTNGLTTTTTTDDNNSSNYSMLPTNHLHSLSFTPLSIDDLDSSNSLQILPTCTNHELLLTNNRNCTNQCAILNHHHCSSSLSSSSSSQFISSSSSSSSSSLSSSSSTISSFNSHVNNNNNNSNTVPISSTTSAFSLQN